MNVIDSDGDTALIYATRNGHEGCVRELVTGGAGVNFRERNGYSALTHVSENGFINCLKELLKLVLN